MRKIWVILLAIVIASSFRIKTEETQYGTFYARSLDSFSVAQQDLLTKIRAASPSSPVDRKDIRAAIAAARPALKQVDFWLRYLEPIAYKKINGPLPVEWENEVFEKFEKPYKRDGAGLTLAELYLNQDVVSKDSLLHLIQLSIDAVKTFRADSITNQLKTPDHFFLCNRLFLLNLAAIYTTGFECPDKGRVIPELNAMMTGTRNIYLNYNQSFPAVQITKEYLALYDKAVDFVEHQPRDFVRFDHFSFIKNYINPLFSINQKLIVQYGIVSHSTNDYTLNNGINSIFDKGLYTPQNTKGIFSMVDDSEALSEIRAIGKLLFYDPILSGNNSRSCASCHKPKQYFTDTTLATNLQFDGEHRLPRNTPTLINVVYNHLLMLDGRHISLQNQGKDVITNPIEMGGSEQEVIKKVLSCREYKSAFKKFLKLTPEENEITLGHIVSAITFYYRDFSNYYSSFDDAMNDGRPLARDAISGFNLFMGKAQCGTCHYVPQFNGVPPPYIGSEFEVIGVPADTAYSRLSEDKGRYVANPAFETMNAFRTGSIRNAAHTKPYMHNGVFRTLDDVITFYDAGGGSGKKLKVTNQTLASDPLKLTASERTELIAFIHSLDEHIRFEEAPDKLPLSSDRELNTRKVGGKY